MSALTRTKTSALTSNNFDLASCVLIGAFTKLPRRSHADPTLQLCRSHAALMPLPRRSHTNPMPLAGVRALTLPPRHTDATPAPLPRRTRAAPAQLSLPRLSRAAIMPLSLCSHAAPSPLSCRRSYALTPSHTLTCCFPCRSTAVSVPRSRHSLAELMPLLSRSHTAPAAHTAPAEASLCRIVAIQRGIWRNCCLW